MRKLVCLVLLIYLLTSPVYGADMVDTSGLEAALPESAKGMLEGFDVKSVTAEGILGRVGAYIKERAASELKAVLRPVSAAVAAALLCCVGESLQLKKDIDYVNLAGCLVISAAAIGDVNSVMAMGRTALGEMHEFSKVLLPTLCSAAAASGAIGSSAAGYAASAMFMDILINCAGNFLLPLVGAYTAALVASASTGDGRLGGPVKLMKWICTKSLTALVAVFSFFIGFTGLAASGADAAAAKTAKAVLSSFVPVVGKMVAGASESLAAGMGLIKNAVGIYGLGAVLAACAAPFLAIGLRYLLFKAAGAVVGMVAGERIGKLVDGLGTAYGMVLALVGTGAVFMFISILSLIRTVL